MELRRFRQVEEVTSVPKATTERRLGCPTTPDGVATMQPGRQYRPTKVPVSTATGTTNRAAVQSDNSRWSCDSVGRKKKSLQCRKSTGATGATVSESHPSDNSRWSCDGAGWLKKPPLRCQCQKSIDVNGATVKPPTTPDRFAMVQAEKQSRPTMVSVSTVIGVMDRTAVPSDKSRESVGRKRIATETDNNDLGTNK
jgi:hypothetical protein